MTQSLFRTLTSGYIFLQEGHLQAINSYSMHDTPSTVIWAVSRKAAAVTEGWMKVDMEGSNWSVHNIPGQMDNCGCSEITLSAFFLQQWRTSY